MNSFSLALILIITGVSSGSEPQLIPELKSWITSNFHITSSVKLSWEINFNMPNCQFCLDSLFRLFFYWSLMSIECTDSWIRCSLNNRLSPLKSFFRTVVLFYVTLHLYLLVFVEFLTGINCNVERQERFLKLLINFSDFLQVSVLLRFYKYKFISVLLVELFM